MQVLIKPLLRIVCRKPMHHLIRVPANGGEFKYLSFVLITPTVCVSCAFDDAVDINKIIISLYKMIYVCHGQSVQKGKLCNKFCKEKFHKQLM